MRQTRSVRPTVAVIASAIIVLGAAVAAWWLWPDASAPVAEDGDGAKKTLIKEVTPAPAPKAEEPKTKKKHVNYWELDASRTNGFTKAMQRKWEIAHRPRRKAAQPNVKKQPYEIFDHFSENRIAMYISIEPGTGLIGSPIINKDFVDDFMKSCEEPIVVSADDDDYTKELKRAMNKTKIEVRERMAKGESLESIITETHNELQKLGQLRNDIEKMANESLNEATTKEDAEIIFEAANKLLEQKGAAPIHMNPLMRANIRRTMRLKAQQMTTEEQQ